MAKKSKTTEPKTAKPKTAKPKTSAPAQNVEMISLRSLCERVAPTRYDRDGGKRLRRALRKSELHQPVNPDAGHKHRENWNFVVGSDAEKIAAKIIERVMLGVKQ